MENRHTSNTAAHKRLEIMAPAGNFECLHAAIQGGANSIYFGVGNLNMRSHSANNFNPEDIEKIVELCNEHGVRSYLTLNIVLYNEDIEPMKEALDAAKRAGIKVAVENMIDFGRRHRRYCGDCGLFLC